MYNQLHSSLCNKKWSVFSFVNDLVFLLIPANDILNMFMQKKHQENNDKYNFPVNCEYIQSEQERIGKFIEYIDTMQQSNNLVFFVSRINVMFQLYFSYCKSPALYNIYS